MLRCSVMVGAAALFAAESAASASAGVTDEVLTNYTYVSLAKAAMKKLEIRDRSKLLAQSMQSTTSIPSLPTPSARAGFETLVLDCEKIGQAQRNLDGALAHGAQPMLVAPGSISSGPPPNGAEIYHITQNQQRIAALGQKFHCAQR
ncbi:MAG: hypothetical protein ABI905_17415 [Betaproteobacteria bacterium]